MVKKLESGDTVRFTQEDGNQLVLVVYPDGIGIQASFPGTDLQIIRDNSFWIKATAIKGA